MKFSTAVQRPSINDPVTPQTAPSRHSVHLASRLEQAQAKILNTIPELILSKEVQTARDKFDTRVSLEQAATLKKICEESQRDFFRKRHALTAEGSGARILMAPTNRVVDYSVGAQAIRILVKELLDEGRGEEIRAVINKGTPSGGIYERCEDPVQLVASILRWSALYGRDKVRITASGSVRNWMHEVLKSELGGEESLRPRLGGISAANTLQGAALGDRVSMMALGPMPDAVSRLLPDSISVVGDNQLWNKLQDLPIEEDGAGHFAFLADARTQGGSLLPEAFGTVTVNGKDIPRENINACDVIVTGNSCIRDFGDLSRERLHQLGEEHQVVILTGAQYLTDMKKCAKYIEDVKTLHRAGATIALSYVETKNKDVECAVLSALRDSRAIDMFSANTGETFQLISRIAKNRTAVLTLGLTPAQQVEVATLAHEGEGHISAWENGHEDPAWIARVTILLQEVLDIPVVRIRGKISDVTVTNATTTSSQRASIVKDLTLSRIIAGLKVANPKGLITQLSDLAFVRNTPHAASLAGLFRIYDALIERGVSQQDAAHLPIHLHAALPNERTIFAIPPIDMYLKDGGTTSAGDLMDYILVSQQVDGLLSAAHQVNTATNNKSEVTISC